ncbi:MAG: HAMP domain-containing histidine kinase [Chloroflexi bacterium]|nr:MAG: HAMP domain-containing histidine kinase [Chloroflexota bacterium]
MSPGQDGGRWSGGRPPWMGPGTPRPPWWPEGEPWPPTRPPWMRYRGRFARRLLALFLLFVAFIFLVSIAGYFFGRWTFGPPEGGTGHPGFFWGFPLFIVVVVVLVLFATRRVRRIAAPVDDLVEAAGRIRSGDYSVRVREDGAPELRSVAQAFNAMTAQLEASEKQRRSFLADVTHELRTPLSVIRGQAEGIADGLYPADAAHLAPIVEATQTLARLVDDLRTLALAETGHLQLQREPVDIATLINDTLASFEPQAQAKGVTLAADIPGELPTVSADAVRIRGVIANLLANAIAHTPTGGSVRISAAPADGGATVSVADTGEGIPADLLPRIFDRFVKTPGSSGSGLGLAIARDLITAHGGTITAESTVGSGTTVRFTLRGS